MVPTRFCLKRADFQVSPPPPRHIHRFGSALQGAANHFIASNHGLPSARLARVRRLIVNADDLGFTSGVNRAIVKAHTDGVVTSATLMANGSAFCEARELAKQLPKLSIGCHVVLIDGEPVLPPARVPSLAQSG